MNVSFTIGYNWLEFFCHFFAAVLYVSAGHTASLKRDFDSFYFLVMAIGLNIVGAHL